MQELRKQRVPHGIRKAQALKSKTVSQCRCGARADGCDSFNPLALVLTERTHPQLLYLQTRWAKLVILRAGRPASTRRILDWFHVSMRFEHVLQRLRGLRKSDPRIAAALLKRVESAAGVAHNVIRQSDDLELIEINTPADYLTVECPL